MADIVANLVALEEARQREMIGLIPSENHSSPEVQSVLGSCLSSKYSEGYPGRRYYEGNQIVDELEVLAVERMKALFGVPYANVPPYSGSPANAAILFALLEPGDTLAGLSLGSGGHLTHGHPKVTFSGRYFNSVQYGLDPDARIDFAGLSRLVKEHRPKLIIVGTTSYPYLLDFGRFRSIADEANAWVVADISRIAGLVAAGVHPSPVEHCDVVMTTTHKTLRGPRGATILVTERGLEREPKLGKAIDAAGLYANRNAIPNEPSSPFYPSGVRLGTPLVTTRGMKEPEMARIADWIARAIRSVEKDRFPEDRPRRSSYVREVKRRIYRDERLLEIKDEVRSLAAGYPLFSW